MKALMVPIIAGVAVAVIDYAVSRRDSVQANRETNAIIREAISASLQQEQTDSRVMAQGIAARSMNQASVVQSRSRDTTMVGGDGIDITITSGTRAS